MKRFERAAIEDGPIKCLFHPGEFHYNQYQTGAGYEAGLFTTRQDKGDVEINIGTASAGVVLLEQGVVVKAGVYLSDVKGAGFSAKLGLAADTGFRIKGGSIEVEGLGSGIQFGNTMGFKFFGTGFSLNIGKFFQTILD